MFKKENGILKKKHTLEMIRRKPTRGGGFVDAYQPVWMFNSRNSPKISLL